MFFESAIRVRKLSSHFLGLWLERAGQGEAAHEVCSQVGVDALARALPVPSASWRRQLALERMQDGPCRADYGRIHTNDCSKKAEQRALQEKRRLWRTHRRSF